MSEHTLSQLNEARALVGKVFNTCSHTQLEDGFIKVILPLIVSRDLLTGVASPEDFVAGAKGLVEWWNGLEDGFKHEDLSERIEWMSQALGVVPTSHLPKRKKRR